MDVIRIPVNGIRLFLPVCFFILSACEMPVNESHPTVEKTVDTCESTAVKDAYLIRWKDGSVSREFAESREALVRDVIAPNQAAIDFAEQDQLIHIKKPVMVSAESVPSVPQPHWGQDRVGASAAWDADIQGQGIIVAVVDSGVDLTHPQLAGQIAMNPHEVINGIDDDANGYIDDVAGWDFNGKSNHVTDGKGHGTHVAGIIAADHTKGDVLGLAPRAKIMPLDFMDDAGNGYIGDAIEAMYYAANNGAKIINASWGGSRCSKQLRAAIADISAKGVLFIAAAGNGDDYGRGENLDNIPTYPAAFDIGSQLTVGASAASDYMAGFSNFSTSLVHLLAPGVKIFSTFPNASTEYLDGTSMATPFVAGAAALVWSHRPNATAQQVHDALLNSVDDGGFPVLSRGRLNVKNAILEIERLVP